MWYGYMTEQKILKIMLKISMMLFVPFRIAPHIDNSHTKKLTEKHLFTKKDLAAFGKKFFLFFYDSQLYGAEGALGSAKSLLLNKH
jgi:hypothetical protein